jgi:hypothetical protein
MNNIPTKKEIELMSNEELKKVFVKLALKNMDTTLVGKEMADRSFEIMLKDNKAYQDLKRIQKLI